VLNPCSLCDANCCKSYTITVTAFDILRISEKTGRKPAEFAVLSQARLLAFDPDTTLDISEDSWVYLLGIRSHPCIFLEANRCSIHDCAPTSCRRYPFQLDSKLNTRFCPLSAQLIFRMKGPDIKTDQMVKELEMHKRIVKEWNRKPGKKEECMDFLMRKAKELAGTF